MWSKGIHRAAFPNEDGGRSHDYPAVNSVTYSPSIDQEKITEIFYIYYFKSLKI